LDNNKRVVYYLHTHIHSFGASRELDASALFRFSHATDEVFAAFGYANPKMVDLHKISKIYRKAHDITWSSKNNLELWY